MSPRSAIPRLLGVEGGLGCDLVAFCNTILDHTSLAVPTLFWYPNNYAFSTFRDLKIIIHIYFGCS
ncbi:predicted protein [Mycobacterium tuberculosis GM 1503]|nr:predicted protein [Mycobacterium tuberculosis GM 1503]